ncbi:MAG: HDOD domain-containing protein [Desulfuromonas sp.]
MSEPESTARKSTVFHLETLPSIPQFLVEMLHLMQQPEVDMDKLVHLLRQDSAITARIFQLAKTVTFRPWKDVHDLHRLVVTLGLNRVRQIILTSAMEQVFSRWTRVDLRQVHDLWYKSLFCAQLAKEVARITGYTPADEAYLAGLLHRLGELLLLVKDPPAYHQHLERSLSPGEAAELERQRWEHTANELSADIVDSWQLSSFVSDALRYQSQPVDQVIETMALVRILNLSRKLTDISTPELASLVHSGAALFSFTEGTLVDIHALAQDRTQHLLKTFILDPEVEKHSIEQLVAEQDQASNALHKEVKKHSLLTVFQSQLAPEHDLASLCQNAALELQLIFGWHRPGFFIFDQKTQCLQGYDPTGQREKLNQLSLKPEGSRSLAVEAFRMREIRLLSAESSGLNLVDQQLVRLFGHANLYSIPLGTGPYCQGLLCLGLPAPDVALFQHKSAFVLQFCEQLGQRLAVLQQQNELSTQENSSEAHNFQLRSTVHEINNPLAIMKNYLHLLEIKLQDQHEIPAEIQVLQEEINRVATLVAGLIDSSQDTQADTPVNINNLVERLTIFLRKSLFANRNIRVELDLDPQVPPLLLNKDKLTQVLLNICKNAAEALPEHSHLTIRTRSQIFMEEECYCGLEIEDNGPGIPFEKQEKLFQPQPSPKPGHAGLGLVVVKNLLNEMGGKISCATGDWGARFQILLPRNVAPAPEKSEER